MACAPIAASAAASQSRAGTPPPMRLPDRGRLAGGGGVGGDGGGAVLGGADLGRGRGGGEDDGEEKPSHGRPGLG